MIQNMQIDGTVLVCYRNRGLLSALVLLLQKVFSQVITESEPEIIMEIIKEKNIDVIILDTGQNLPAEQREHLNFIKMIKGLGQCIQVVVLTNFSQNSFGLEAAKAGAFDFVPKPWNNEKLLVALNNACRMRNFELALQNRKEEESDAVTLEQMEKKMMRTALKRNNGNITLAAEQLGITRQTLYNKGKKYKLFK